MSDHAAIHSIRKALAGLALLACVALIGATSRPFTQHDKAFYASDNTINFVRPGLVLKITSASIASDGTIQARFKITDSKGLGLDRAGVATPGPVSISFIAGVIPSGHTQYTSYTTRVQKSPITGNSATQAGTDSGGTFDKGANDGEYIYTFKTKAPSGFDAHATHSIGAYSSRDLATEFDLGTQYSDNVYTFVPDGSAVTTTRDVVRTATCNSCHDPLSAHGGARQSVELCVMCHTPQTTDPDTGNTVDFAVMVHKIHQGENLPSVQAGKPYQIIGFNQGVNDFSTVAFPNDTRNCQACHKDGAAQSNAYLKPNRAACGSCHDNVNFATGENHVDLPQVSDNQCSTCHIPQGELDFDASIMGAHLIPRFSTSLKGVVIEIVSVDGAAPGKGPTVTFTLKDKSGAPYAPSGVDRLAINMGGPSTDYKWYVTEDARKATGANGQYTWTMANPLPADAKGTYTIGMEAYKNATLLPGTKQAVTLRDAAVNKTLAFSVDGSKLAPRRQIVSLDKCNACHGSLSVHGDNRNQIENCVICHNPTNTDIAQRSATSGPAQSVDFRTMIHRIHTGENNERPMIVYGFGKSKNDFSEVRYPGDRRNCNTCHVNGSEQLPLSAGHLSVNDPEAPIPNPGPETAACVSCHTAIFASSHALANTTTLGESCSTCHGSSADFSINRVHAR